MLNSMHKLFIKICLIITCLFYSLFIAQNKKFIYEYSFVPDSTRANIMESELMILDIGKTKSQFYGLLKYKSDSTLLADSKRGVFSMPAEKKIVSDRVIKDRFGQNMSFITMVSNSLYAVNEKKGLKWSLLPEYSEVLGYKVQKATTNFRGRTWSAWFSKDIPIQEGPYKFAGLPGLILKISDSLNNHVFILKGIENNVKDFIYPEIKNYSNKFELDYKQYAKIYRNYRANPVADLIGKIPDYKDAEGRLISGQQKVREIEEVRKKEILRDNNIIEIELLKK